MTEIDQYHLIDTDDERVLEWRAQCLMSAGYDVEDAFSIAADTRIDLHDAVALVESGCPTDLAVEILL
jgi:hypothetical protein